MSESSSTPPSLGKTRLEALTDGIFATVMTVLVLGLSVPIVTGQSTSASLLPDLQGLLPDVVAYVISFIILGVYWVGHHNMFHFIKRTDRILLWLNMLFLLTIGFIPFSASLLGRYPGEQLSIIIYGVNAITVGIALHTLWWYATTRHRLVEASISPLLISGAKRRTLMGPIIALASIAVSFLSTQLSIIIYALIPIFYILPGRIDIHFTSRAEPRESS